MSTVALADQSLDLNGQQLHRIVSLYGAPGYVKEANVDALCGGEGLEPHMFADVTTRRFPCHSAPAVWASAAFFYEKQAEIEPEHQQRIEAGIVKSAAYFGIQGDVSNLKEKVAAASEYDETQLTDDVFALVMDFGDRRQRLYPMRNAPEVQKAAEYLFQYRDHLRYEDRCRVADKILSKAAAFGADISSHQYMLEKTAGVGICSAADAAELVRTRIAAMGNTHQPTQLQQGLEKLAATLEAHGENFRHYAPLTKIAGIVDQIDHQFGFNREYSNIIKRPEDVLFAVTEKSATQLSSDLVGLTTGNFYKRSDLQNVPLQTFSDALGADFASAIATADAWVDIEKMAEIIPTLPRNDAVIFDAAMMEAGVSPYAQKSASVGTGISPEVTEKMAEAHESSGPGPGSLWSRMG